ncbi:MAG: hypoxanthine phosphoribosyltransferase [Acidobacteriota bacterium]|nr:hypoxanthine phosphoribosyltransferase [Acidobacteriota bacterium]
MHPDLERVLFTQDQILKRIHELAGEISRDYEGRELMLVAVLKGAVFFLTHLAQALTIPARIDYLGIASFSPGKALPGVVRISKDLDLDIQGMDVLVVEDIVDTGLTLRYLLNILSGREPNSLFVCTFLDKATRRLVEVPVRYRCFEIPDRFVVGFGLDYDQRYRTLPCVGILKSHIYQ